MSGTRARGRSRTAWLDNIKPWSGLALEEVRATKDSQQWKRIIHDDDAAKPRTEDG